MRVVTGDGTNSASSAADPPIETAPLSHRSVTLNLVPPTPYLNVVECFLGRRLAEFIPVKRPPPLRTRATPTLKLGVGGPAPHENLNVNSCSDHWQNFFRHLSEGDGFNASRRAYVPQFGSSAALLPSTPRCVSLASALARPRARLRPPPPTTRGNPYIVHSLLGVVVGPVLGSGCGPCPL